MKKNLLLALIAIAAFAAEGFKIAGKIKIGGAGGWDYVVADGANHRVYASHGNSIAIVDTADDKVVGTITDLHGVHGIAVAPEFNKGFISNGQSATVTIFDLKTFAKVGETKTGQNPDAICYEPKTKRVFTFNGRSNDSTAIDAKTGDAIATFPVGEKPEYCAAGGDGKIYANIESTSELVEIDAAKPEVIRRASVKPCEEPSGLAIDQKDHLLFSVCDKVMAVTDIATMKVIATPAIGQGPDAAGFDPDLGLAFASNGQDATLSIVKKVNGKWETVDTVPTERGARTMTVDTKTHKVYLLAAEVDPNPPAPADGKKKGRGPAMLPDSFHLLIVAK